MIHFQVKNMLLNFDDDQFLMMINFDDDPYHRELLGEFIYLFGVLRRFQHCTEGPRWQSGNTLASHL